MEDDGKEGAVVAMSENRIVPRIPGETIGPLKLRAESSSLSFSANVRDVSILGVGLIANEAIDSGTSLLVEGGPSGKGMPAKLAATVRHATTLPNGAWILGCVFSRHLTLADFEVLG